MERYFLLWIRAISIVVLCVTVITAQRNKPWGHRRDREKSRHEIDPYSGDAYSEFVDKYYGKSGHSDVEMIEGGKITNIQRKSVFAKAGSPFEGSGYRKSSFVTDDEDYDDADMDTEDEDDDDEEDDEESSGMFPEEFDGNEGRRYFTTEELPRSPTKTTTTTTKSTTRFLHSKPTTAPSTLVTSTTEASTSTSTSPETSPIGFPASSYFSPEAEITTERSVFPELNQSSSSESNFNLSASVTPLNTLTTFDQVNITKLESLHNNTLESLADSKSDFEHSTSTAKPSNTTDDFSPSQNGESFSTTISTPEKEFSVSTSTTLDETIIDIDEDVDETFEVSTRRQESTEVKEISIDGSGSNPTDDEDFLFGVFSGSTAGPKTTITTTSTTSTTLLIVVNNSTKNLWDLTIPPKTTTTTTEPLTTSSTTTTVRTPRTRPSTTTHSPPTRAPSNSIDILMNYPSSSVLSNQIIIITMFSLILSSLVMLILISFIILLRKLPSKASLRTTAGEDGSNCESAASHLPLLKKLKAKKKGMVTNIFPRKTQPASPRYQTTTTTNNVRHTNNYNTYSEASSTWLMSKRVSTKKKNYHEDNNLYY